MKVLALMSFREKELLQNMFQEVQEHFRQKARTGEIQMNHQTTIRRLKSYILGTRPASRQNCPAGATRPQAQIREKIMAEQSSPNQPGKDQHEFFRSNKITK